MSHTNIIQFIDRSAENESATEKKAEMVKSENINRKSILSQQETWKKLNAISTKHPFCIWYRHKKNDPL